MVVIIKKKLYIIVLFFFFCNSINSSEILDFETEIFIDKIIDKIKEENEIKKDIKFKIIASNNINAFVDQNNVIYITSGLIENCLDYVALLAVVAHEIGHIDNNHIIQRKLNIDKIKKINNFSNFSIIAGSLISGNPELINSIILSSAGTTSYHINFSKDQEREADIYSLNTIIKMGLYSNSIIKLLETIEAQGLNKGLTKEKIKTSFHPYFEERIDIINYLKQKNNPSFDIEKNKQFKFIQAKFLGYNENVKNINKLPDPYKTYAYSILNARKGDLKKSLKDLNKLILRNKNNIFLIETKADILFSYGYINESIRFYEKVLSNFPENNYAQIRIFENQNIENLNKNEINSMFIKNLNLLKKYYNNKNLLLKYMKLAEKGEMIEWYNFLYFWLNKNTEKEIVIKNLNIFKKTSNKNLLKLIEIIYSDIL